MYVEIIGAGARRPTDHQVLRWLATYPLLASISFAIFKNLSTALRSAMSSASSPHGRSITNRNLLASARRPSASKTSRAARDGAEENGGRKSFAVATGDPYVV